MAEIYHGQLTIDSAISEGCSCTVECFPMPVHQVASGSDNLRIAIYGERPEEADLLASGLRHWHFDVIVMPGLAGLSADVLICLSDSGDYITQWQTEREIAQVIAAPAVVLSRLPNRSYDNTTWLERPINRQRLADVLRRIHNQDAEPKTRLSCASKRSLFK